MNNIFALAVALSFALGGVGHAALRIVATVPDLADITKEVGGKLVTIDTLARGPEDIHQVTMRPSFVPKLNRADAVVLLGLGVEHSFLPALLRVASNPKIVATQNGCAGPGCIDCSKNIHILERPETLSRAEGELHPFGNPHYNLGADNGPTIARNIADGLSAIDPAHRAEYEKNLQAYLNRLDQKIALWKKWCAPLKGVKAVSYHKDVAYLGAFTGIEFVDTIEPKPGVAPSPRRVAELAQMIKEKNVKLIVREQQYDAKIPSSLAAETGASVAEIAALGNALPHTETFIELCEANLRAILKALGKEPS